MKDRIISNKLGKHNLIESKEQSHQESKVEFDTTPSQQTAEVCIKLRNLIESRVEEGTSVEIPALTISEYFDRVSGYRMTYTGNIFNDFLNTKAGELLAECKDTDSINKVILNINSLVENEPWVTKAADELIEYRALQQIRSTFDCQDLVDCLLPLFLDEVNGRTAFKFGSAIVDLEAELSMFLTDSERREFLELEYRNRLANYKQRAQTSAIKKYVYDDVIPVRWFSKENIEDTYFGIVDNYVWFNEPDEIELDLSVSRVFHGVNNDIKYETADLVTLWQVIEWIRNKIEKPILLNKPDSIDKSTDERKNQLPALYIAPRVRQALYDALSLVVDESCYYDLSALILDNKMPSNTIKHHSQQNSLAYVFRQLSTSENNLIMGTKIGIAQWICTHFTPTTHTTIYDVIRGKTEPMKNNRIPIAL